MKNEQKHKEFGILFFLHITLALCYYLSPFLLNWRVVGVICFLIFLQYVLAGECLLTKAEFKEKSKQTGFYYHYLPKVGIKLKKRTIDRMSYILPFVLLSIALIWQQILRHKPVLF